MHFKEVHDRWLHVHTACWLANGFGAFDDTLVVGVGLEPALFGCRYGCITEVLDLRCTRNLMPSSDPAEVAATLPPKQHCVLGLPAAELYCSDSPSIAGSLERPRTVHCVYRCIFVL